MKNNGVLLIVGIIILLSIGILFFYCGGSGYNYGFTSGSVGNISKVSENLNNGIEKEFINGENVENLINFSTMGEKEKKEYATKLAASKGYEYYDHFSEGNFEIWYGFDYSFNPEKLLDIIINKKTGKVVIYYVN